MSADRRCISNYKIHYIDEIRISAVARYDVKKQGFTPRNKFKKELRTIALWHFDEPGEIRKFSDASGNAYHLTGEGGAAFPNYAHFPP